MTQATMEPVGLPAGAKSSVLKARLSPQNPLHVDATNQQVMSCGPRGMLTEEVAVWKGSPSTHTCIQGMEHNSGGLCLPGRYFHLLILFGFSFLEGILTFLSFFFWLFNLKTDRLQGVVGQKPGRFASLSHPELKPGGVLGAGHQQR